jgi:predicted RNA-binding Zn ribbon-like protein
MLHVEDFRLDGFTTWVNFLVTKRHPLGARARELLTTPQRLRAWLRAVGLEPRGAVTEVDLAAAIELREALRALALAHGDGNAPPRGAVRTLERALEADDRPGVATRGGRLVRQRPADAPAALGRIAREATDDLTGAKRDALRICDEHDCRWVFLDPTGRQRWCTPECASRGRVRAHRARHQLKIEP